MNYIELKIDGGLQKINTRDILYIQALGNYAKVVCRSRSMLSLITLRELEEMLGTGFLRIHKSFIVNTYAIEEKTRAMVVIKDRELPIGKTYKNSVHQLMSM